METNAIEFTNVCKSFGKKKVLTGLNLHVPEGSVYAFLGCNGVGKSTSVKLMVGQLEQDSGEVRIFGLNPMKHPVELRLQTGYVAENQRLYDELTLKEICSIFESFFPDWDPKRCSELIRRFKLPENKPLRTFSRGMYSKATLLGALSRTPKLMILDDPTLGLDTVARREFMDGILDSIQEFRHTILISSHLLSELEGICDYVGIIGNGTMLAEGELDRLRSDISAVILQKNETFPILPGELRRKTKAGETEIIFRAPVGDAKDFLTAAGQRDFRFKTLTLEEIFVALTGD